MINKISRVILVILVSLNTGCIKETYDMNKLSKKAHLSPTMAVSAIKGDISFSDLVKSSDTVVFDQNNFVKIVFKEDSVIDFKMADFYDLNNMVNFSEAYTVGDMSIAPFYQTMNFSLNQISTHFSPALRAQFVALDNTTNNFPAFPSTNLGESSFPLVTNFEIAIFSSGAIDISIRNNLTTPLYGINIQLYNSVGHTVIGNQGIISLIQPGELGLTSIDLTDETVTNSIIAAIVITGSPGTSTPVLIDLDGSNIELGIRGRDLKVKSGRVILPVQTIESLDNKDTVSFNPGSGIELDEFKITTGTLSYRIQSSSPVKATLGIVFPTALRSGVSMSETFNVNPNTILNGTIPVDNTIIDLGVDPGQPFNRLPMGYSIVVSSDGLMVNFDRDDAIQLDLELLNPVFDYAKGYFGQQVETIDPDTFNLEIDDILSHITGDFLVSSPSIKLNYLNSFAIPIQITLNATGKREAETVNLGLTPFTLTYPVAPADRDVTASFTIDKSNSSLPELISMPPEEIRFSGSAKMNPAGNNGMRDNYIFGDSRFLGSLEIEVPMEFRINNLQFTDTVDNFLADAFDNESELNWEDFELFRIDFDVENGFPLGASLNMGLRDSVSLKVISSIDASELLKAAPVDGNGIATGVTLSSASITFTHDFFSSIKKADKIIFKFTLNTTDNGTKDVRIYSDYRINFKAALVLKPDIKFNLK